MTPTKCDSVTSYFDPCEAKRRLQGTLALRRYQGAMPPRKRAAHLKKLADAKVAKVAKEEQAQSSHNALFNPGKVAPPPASEDSQPSKKARLGRPPGSRDSEQRTRRTGDGVTLSFLLSPVLSVLLCSLLLSSLLSSLFPLLVSCWGPLVYPPCSVQLFARSPFPMSLSSLCSSFLPLSLLSVFSLLSPLLA